MSAEEVNPENELLVSMRGQWQAMCGLIMSKFKTREIRIGMWDIDKLNKMFSPATAAVVMQVENPGTPDETIVLKLMDQPSATKLMNQDLANRKPAFRDIADKPEDERIAEIVHGVQSRPGKKVAFLVDDDVNAPGKADRYWQKIKAMDPRILFVSRSAGPVAGVTSIIITIPDGEQP